MRKIETANSKIMKRNRMLAEPSRMEDILNIPMNAGMITMNKINSQRKNFTSSLMGKINKKKTTEKIEKTSLNVVCQGENENNTQLNETEDKGNVNQLAKKGDSQNLCSEERMKCLNEWTLDNFCVERVNRGKNNLDDMVQEYLSDKVTYFNYELKDFKSRYEEEKEIIGKLREARTKMSKNTKLDKEISIKDKTPVMDKEERKNLKEKLKDSYEGVITYFLTTFKHCHPFANLFAETGRM